MKERIKLLRNSLGLTQQKFADRLGLKRQTIAAYEIGNIEPSESTLLLICKEFGISEKWLRYNEGEMKIEDCLEERYATNVAKLQRTDNETIIRWVNAIAETSPESLKDIESFLKKILGIEE